MNGDPFAGADRPLDKFDTMYHHDSMHALFDDPRTCDGPHVTPVDDLPALAAAIDASSCQLAICPRDTDPALAALGTLAIDPITSIDTIMPVAQLASDLPRALMEAGYPADLAVPLAIDIARLARFHAGIRRVAAVRIRLEWIVTDACRRFHMDYVTTRLLVTYRGAGTQWVEATRPDAIRHIPRNAIALLKGRRLVAEPAILHRSPPLADPAAARLLLVVDPVAADD